MTFPLSHRGLLGNDLATIATGLARSYVGVTEHPAGSNRGPEVDTFLRHVGLDPTRGKYPWCAAFVSYCIAHLALAPTVFRGSAAAAWLIRLNRGLLLDHPTPNCVFVIDHGKGKGHTGFVYAVDVSDRGLLHTVEGNTDLAGSRTGGSVCVRTRRINDCCAFIRIA